MACKLGVVGFMRNQDDKGGSYSGFKILSNIDLVDKDKLFTARCTLCKASVRLSVRLSVCDVDVSWAYRLGWTSSKLITRIISLESSLQEPQHRQSSPKGTRLKFGQNRCGVALLRKPTISLKRGKIGPRLLLTTNRKLHTRFRLVPKSTTLDDLEGPLRTLFQKTYVFRSPPRKFE